MGTIVHGLLDDGLLEELEALDAGRVGKPARPLWFFAAGAGTVLTVELRRQVVAARWSMLAGPSSTSQSRH